MGRQVLKGFFLLFLLQSGSYADSFDPSSSEGVCLRFHSQWKVGEAERRQLQKQYGFFYLTFDKKGEILARTLSPTHQRRLLRLYQQCMKDGCLFCDASEGSCEAGNCGPNNRDCKPYMGPEGRPLCGEECAYYGLRQLTYVNSD